MTAFRSIAVIGAGAWGTALAMSLRRAGLATTLWARDTELADEIARTHRNERRLPGVALDPAIVATSDLGAVMDADIVLIAAPAQSLRSVARQLRPLLGDRQPVIIAAKGLERGDRVVPREEHDQRLDAILTPAGFRQLSKS